MSIGPRVGRLSRRAATVRWVPTTLAVGMAIAACWSLWDVATLEARLVRDGILFLLVPAGIAHAAGRDLGWRVDRDAIRTAIVLTALVLPLYVVGSSLQSVRAGYPVVAGGGTGLTFAYRAAVLLALVVATETFYRGLLCVGIRRIGPVAILVSPVLYALQHLGSVPIELLLAAPADVLFGAADYRSHSILPSIVAHGTGLVLLEWLTMRPPLFGPSQLDHVVVWLVLPI